MEVFSAIFLAILFVGCQGYSTGPPQDACQDAVPQHVPNVPQDSPCPYLVDSPAFTPGTPHILNITSWTGEDNFKGFQITVFDPTSVAVGTFDGERTICDGAAATQSEGSDKTFYEVKWTPPSNSSQQIYFVWLSIVKTYDQFWVNCDPVMLPAVDAPVFTTLPWNSTAWFTYPYWTTTAEPDENNDGSTTARPRRPRPTTTALAAGPAGDKTTTKSSGGNAGSRTLPTTLKKDDSMINRQSAIGVTEPNTATLIVSHGYSLFTLVILALL